jgi:hypothetical protein
MTPTEAVAIGVAFLTVETAAFALLVDWLFLREVGG